MPPQSETLQSAALIERARRADGQARFHKRQMARHRRALREWRQKQTDIEAECARLGIELTYIYGAERNSHGRTIFKETLPPGLLARPK